MADLVALGRRQAHADALGQRRALLGADVELARIEVLADLDQRAGMEGLRNPPEHRLHLVLALAVIGDEVMQRERQRRLAMAPALARHRAVQLVGIGLDRIGVERQAIDVLAPRFAAEISDAHPLVLLGVRQRRWHHRVEEGLLGLGDGEEHDGRGVFVGGRRQTMHNDHAIAQHLRRRQ